MASYGRQSQDNVGDHAGSGGSPGGIGGSSFVSRLGEAGDGAPGLPSAPKFRRSLEPIKPEEHSGVGAGVVSSRRNVDMYLKEA